MESDNGIGISKNFLSFLLAAVIVAGILTFVESNINRKSALGLFALIFTGMILSQPLVIGRLTAFVNEVREGALS